MAIIRSLAIGKARGSAGNLTFSTIKGRTIAREKPAFVSNPNTEKQLSQRLKMRNAVAAYRAIGSQVKDLFTVIPRYGSAYNQFIKSNIAIADNFEIDEATGNVKNIIGMCVANGVYPSQCFTIKADLNGVGAFVRNLQLSNEMKAGDMVFAVGTPAEGDGVPQVYSHVITESDLELDEQGLVYLEITNVPDLSNIAVAWYSPSTHRSSTAYVVENDGSVINP